MVRTLGILLLFWGAVSASGAASMRLYVTNSLGDDISVIDLATLKRVQTFKVGEHVHGICAGSDTRSFFVTIESEHNLKIVDARTGRILGAIPLTGRPNQCAATPDGRYVGVPIRDGNSVDIVDMQAIRGAGVRIGVDTGALDQAARADCRSADHGRAVQISGCTGR